MGGRCIKYNLVVYPGALTHHLCSWASMIATRDWREVLPNNGCRPVPVLWRSLPKVATGVGVITLLVPVKRDVTQVACSPFALLTWSWLHRSSFCLFYALLRSQCCRSIEEEVMTPRCGSLLQMSSIKGPRVSVILSKVPELGPGLSLSFTRPFLRSKRYQSAEAWRHGVASLLTNSSLQSIITQPFEAANGIWWEPGILAVPFSLEGCSWGSQLSL